MLIDLNKIQIETILTSLEYSKQRIRDAQGTPTEVRHDNLNKIDEVAEKLRKERKK
ncbi:MAG: hypothetical protein ABUK01_05885 [Leptospirales bacterium]